MKTKLTSVVYLGYTAMDRRFSNAMLPWLLREVRATGTRDKLSIAVEDGYLKAYNGNFEPVIVHRLVDILRASQVPGRPEELFYILFNEKEGLLNLADSVDLPGQLSRLQPTPISFLLSKSAALSSGLGWQPFVGNILFCRYCTIENQEKALKARRHSLMSTTDTTLSINNSTENLTDKKQVTYDSKLYTSTTPLEPDKGTPWKSVETLTDKERNKPTDKIDEEFDIFTKERADSQKRLDVQLVLGAPSKNLGTVDEDEEKIDINSVISETAASITQFYQNVSDAADIENKVANNTLKHITDVKTVSVDNNLIKHPLHISEEGECNDVTDNVTKDIDKFASNIINVTNNNITNITNKEDLYQNVANIVAKTESNPFTVSTKSDPEIKYPNKIRFEEVLRSRSGSRDSEKRIDFPENKPFLRDRSASIGTINNKTPIAQLIGEQNRTMLFQVGRAELRLISPDRKQILLHRAFQDVASCVVGRVNTDHLGFVCREINETYACYVFKCESEAIVVEVVNAIKQAFASHAEYLKKARDKSPNMTCEHCPMLWYHKLCHDIEGMNDKKTHAFILRRLEQLPYDEQELIIAKYQGGTNHIYETSEHNAFLMMLLRAHCEAKQQRHVHDTAENRSEFLNQYLGGSTIIMKAAKRGFDHLLKRRVSKDNGVVAPAKKESSPMPASIPQDISSQDLTVDSIRSKSVPPVIQETVAEIQQPTKTDMNSAPEEQTEDTKVEAGTPVNSPMMDIFLKVSDSRPAQNESGTEPDATWRQAIYLKVVQPTDVQGEGENPSSLLGKSVAPSGRRSRQQLRELWRMAIDQTILLVRMEKENTRLKESEESSAVRRIKLEYTELGVCDAGVSLMWDSLLTKDPSQPTAKVDRHMLTQAVIRGVPRMSRGAVWYFLAEQASLRSPPPDTKAYPRYHTPYRTLLGGLTKHQHAILIDLGRTFPKHLYYASALGPGQLALYNILKAYSLLDPDVGYCQGLSFVAGVLLLHMEEAEAYILLRHLMFRRGLRKQYLPDMSALQVQLYQLSRLLRDHEPELHAKLESLDISPALYAAPWMLTLFTSQFPLGFVVRVFDLIFLESLDVVFSVSLSLLSAHKDGLMLCESCEEAAEYLKHKLPDMDKVIYEKVMKKVYSMDIHRQLCDYAVEYAVLREEMPRLASLTEENRQLAEEKRRMCEELDSAMEALTNYQKQQARLETSNKLLEQQLALLSKYITAHRLDMPIEIKKIVHNNSKRLSFSTKIFSGKFSNEDDDPRKNFKQGTSSPNLFAKNRDESTPKQNSPEIERRFTMKKSASVHSGLITRLKVLDEKTENFDNRRESITESLKELIKKKDNATTEEQILTERLFEQQLKHDFDENLRKLDEKYTAKLGDISQTSYIDDLKIFQGTKSMSLNLKPPDLLDSGFATPLSPEKSKDDTSSVISHPLSDCDVDIKFDGHSTVLKQKRPLKHCLEKIS
ncbi:hypothetical protein K1T71_000955 [Dendrolimus kikuchii]|uniref:Uncharacterized protein n=1 Tax=Dendrolimus kikuchii TaxID=765133 RepID=A0ACC1DGU1_9NEOP|nr:hypothetical protein K1T71_000955 [Dendrolimus kikuchii]